jgi:hypothetical protein
MNKMKKYIFIPLILSLTACSSIKYQTGMEFKAPEFGGGSQQSEVKYPDWYTEKPAKDDTALYAVASEHSGNFQFSMDKAMLSAKRELASQFSSHIDALFKDYLTEIGDADSSTVQEINRTTKMIVSKVNLIGVQRTNFKVVHEKDGYRAFVKLKYNADQSNKLLVSEVKKNRKLSAKLEASKAFKDLEDTIDKMEKQ